MWHKIDKNLKNLIFVAGVIIFCIVFSNIIFLFSWNALILIPILVIGFLLIYYFTKDPFIGLIFIIFFLPFERIPSFDAGFATLKINQFLGGILIFAWILSKLYNKKKFSPNALVWPLVLFLLTGFVSVMYSLYFSRALMVFIFILFTVSLFFITVDLINSKEKLKIISKVLLYSSLIVCGFSIFQFIGDSVGLPITITGMNKGFTKVIMGFPRVHAFSYEPLYLANYLFIPLGVFTGLFFEKVDFIKRHYLIATIALIILIMILTVSRGAYLGLIAFGLVFAFFEAKKVFSIKYIITAIAILFIAFYGSISFMKYATPIAYDRFVSHATLEDYGKGESTESRMKAWQDAFDAYSEKPYTGVGLGNFGPWLAGYPNPETVENWKIVNNEYMEILAETGIFGFISFIIFLLIIIIRSFIAYFKVKDPLLRAFLVGLLASTIAVLVQYNFFSTLYIVHIWVLFGLLVAVQNLIFIEKNKG